MIDIASLTPMERLDLISRLWDSLDADDVPLTQAQSAELDRRLASLGRGPNQGRDAEEVLGELRRRYK